MTAPAPFVRDAADVQAMRLGNVPALNAAAAWIRDHGINATVMDYCLHIHGGNGRMRAVLGDWVTLDLRTAVFAVVPDCDFQVDHKRRGDMG